MKARRFPIAATAASLVLLLFPTPAALAGSVSDNPAAKTETIRIVLNWGLAPADLDAHLTGPAADAGRRFHLSYFDARLTEGSTEARLEADEDEGYGPETIVLANPGRGVYRYSVHDFGDRYLEDAEALSNSGASVTVYRGDDVVGTFYPRVNAPGTLWTVFELRDGEIVPVDALTFEDDPTGIE